MAGKGRLTRLAESVLERARALLPDAPRLIALSGGADSAVCAWVAKHDHETRGIFIDHGFPESALMAEAARQVATNLGIALVEVPVEVGEGASVEALARAARYRALEAAARTGEVVLTGHTADDQAETVLANLLRGAGAEGLAGIPLHRGPFVRPLLNVTRAEVRELASLLALPFRDDPSNAADEFRRNVVRRRVLPLLEDEFNPRLREALRRAAALIGADDRVLDERADRVPLHVGDGTVRIPAALLAVIPLPVASRAVRRALRAVRGPYAGELREVEAVLAIARGGPARSGLAEGFEALREGPWVTIHGASPAELTPIPVRLPGSHRAANVRLDAWIEDRTPSPWPLGRRVAVFDAEAVGPEAVLRAVLEGEGIDLGDGTKSVRDALAEGGVPERLRGRWPAVEARGKLAWLVGVRKASWASPTVTTRRFLWIAADVEHL